MNEVEYKHKINELIEQKIDILLEKIDNQQDLSSEELIWLAIITSDILFKK